MESQQSRTLDRSTHLKAKEAEAHHGTQPHHDEQREYHRGELDSVDGCACHPEDHRVHVEEKARGRSLLDGAKGDGDGGRESDHEPERGDGLGRHISR